MKSKRKVWRFLQGHRRYRLLPGPTRPFIRCFLSASKAALLLRPVQLATAVREMLGQSMLVVAEKVEDWEPDYNFFRQF